MRNDLVEQARKIRAAMNMAGEIMTDDQAMDAVALFSPWTIEHNYNTGDRVRYNDILYKCLQSHISQSTWQPDLAVSLWTRIDNPAIEWPNWIQPSSTNPYAKGAKVSHKDKKWTSNIDGNVWEPGVYGWNNIV